MLNFGKKIARKGVGAIQEKRGLERGGRGKREMMDS